MITAAKFDDARVRKISPAMPIKLRKHSANLLQQQQQQQQQQLRRQVLSPAFLPLAEAQYYPGVHSAVLKNRVILDWLIITCL